MKVNAIILLIFVSSLSFNSKGQGIIWDEVDKKKFVEDTIAGRTKNYLRSSYGFPEPSIQESRAILEVRMTPTFHQLDPRVFIIRYYKDSTILTGMYSYENPELQKIRKQYWKSSNEEFTKKVTPVFETIDRYCWESQSYMLSRFQAKKLLLYMLNFELFDENIDGQIDNVTMKLRNSDMVADAPIEHYPPMIAGRIATLFEIKYRDKYREFFTKRVGFYQTIDNRWISLGSVRLSDKLEAYIGGLFYALRSTKSR